jgi:hypothetical protein
MSDMACIRENSNLKDKPFNAERLIKASLKIPSKNMREKPTNTPIIH